MADLIKKVKVMQTDGTFTDYIPLGADAVNVKTEDGMSVENKLKKKPYYFDTVADMKTYNLNVGDCAITKGYYQANDGGSGYYEIVNNNTLVEDNGKIHNLMNGLKAVLIVNDEINVKQYGAIGNASNDDTTALVNAFKSGYKVYIPIGNYNFNSQLVVENVPIIKCAGTLRYVGNETNGVVILGNATEQNLKDIEIRLVTPTKFTNESNAGIILKNINNSNINLKYVANFGIGCKILADKVGSCYNEITLGYFYNNLIGLCLQSDNGGWVNENLFLNGNIKANSTYKNNSLGILLDSNNQYNCDNNQFIKTSFESLNVAIKINYGHQNKFENIRSEDNNMTCITLNNSASNLFKVGYGDMNYSFSNKTNSIKSKHEDCFGFGNKIFYTDLVNDSNQEIINNIKYLKLEKAIWLNSGGSTSTAVSYEGNVEVNENYLIQKVTSKAIGIFIDTTKAKKFLLKKITESGYAGRWCIRCFDTDKNVIPNNNVLFSAFDTMTAGSEINNYYRTGANLAHDLYLILNDEVKYVFLGFTKIGNNDIHIKSFEIYSDYEAMTSQDLNTL